jgi:glycosyltransferase involved in cell wall biosynthesis
MISAVILTHNNEATIQRTLESLLWCDERIAIDDFSTDKTVSIASAYKTKIIQHHLSDDFATQRNFGLDQTKGEWVLYVDSDEVVSEKLKKEILQAIKNDQIIGYFVQRKDIVFGNELKHGETAGVRLLRLAKKTAGSWERPVHEIWSVLGPTSQLANPLFHLPHPDVAQFLDDINRYSTLNAKYLYSQQIREPVWYIVAYPAAKFFVNYVWRMGFLDGTAGIIIAIMMSFHSFLTRAKLYMLWKR